MSGSTQQATGSKGHCICNRLGGGGVRCSCGARQYVWMRSCRLSPYLYAVKVGLVKLGAQAGPICSDVPQVGYLDALELIHLPLQCRSRRGESVVAVVSWVRCALHLRSAAMVVMVGGEAVGVLDCVPAALRGHRSVWKF